MCIANLGSARTFYMVPGARHSKNVGVYSSFVSLISKASRFVNLSSLNGKRNENKLGFRPLNQRAVDGEGEGEGERAGESVSEEATQVEVFLSRLSQLGTDNACMQMHFSIYK